MYIDDLIITNNNSAALHKFKGHLITCFHMKDLGPLKYVLGIELAQNSQGIHLCQHKYALDILVDASLIGTKAQHFSMEPNHKLGKSNGPLLILIVALSAT